MLLRCCLAPILLARGSSNFFSEARPLSHYQSPAWQGDGAAFCSSLELGCTTPQDTLRCSNAAPQLAYVQLIKHNRQVLCPSYSSAVAAHARWVPAPAPFVHHPAVMRPAAPSLPFLGSPASQDRRVLVLCLYRHRRAPKFLPPVEQQTPVRSLE